MIQDTYLNNSVDTFMIENSEEVNLIDAIIIDNNLYGRIDIIINRYYKGRLDLIPILMNFNKITDPVEINIGMLFKIPDIESLETQLSINTILDDDNVPGILKNTNNIEVNKSNLKKINNSLRTTALPKLNITLPKVSYNNKTGTVTY